MKFRKDFVTNSSSSSFVCEICGDTASGWDMGLSKAGMYECINGHTFCEDEALDAKSEDLITFILENEYNIGSNTEGGYLSKEALQALNNDELSEIVTDKNGNYEIPECFCPICNFIEYSSYDLCDFLLKEYKVPRELVFNEVKLINKRRKKLYDSEYITYVCNKFDLKPAQIVKGWEKRFGTYSKFSDWLRH